MLRRTLSAFALAAITVSVNAQDGPARFIVDRIEVRNAQRVPPAVIIAETLLREGNEYSADDVRAAVRHLVHLPFFLSADFALEKGSDERHRVVVITVTEFKRFSFLLDGRGIVLNDVRRT